MAEENAVNAMAQVAATNQQMNMNIGSQPMEMQPQSVVVMMDPPYPQPPLYDPNMQMNTEQPHSTKPSSGIPNYGMPNQGNDDNQVKPIMYAPSGPGVINV